MPKATKADKVDQKTKSKTSETKSVDAKNDNSKTIENDESENVTVVKLTSTAEKFIKEVNKNDVVLSEECLAVDNILNDLELKIKKMLKQKYNCDEEAFSEQRHIYVQMASIISRIDGFGIQLIHSLNELFKKKKAGEAEDEENDEENDESEQPTKIGKPKKKLQQIQQKQ